MGLRTDLLGYALKQLDQVSKIGEKSTSIEATRLAILVQTGDVYKLLGQTQKAFDQYRAALDIARKRVALKANSDASRNNLSIALLKAGEIAELLDRDMKKQLDYLEEALKVRESILSDSRGDQEGNGRMSSEAILPLVAELLTRVGVVHHRLGDPAKARDYFRRALDVRERFLRDFPADPDGAKRQDLARSDLAVGETGFRLGDVEAARGLFERCIALRRDLTKAFPAKAFFAFELAGALSMYGEYLARIGEPEGGLPRIEEARAIQAKLVEADKTDVRYARDLGLADRRLGLVYGHLAKPDPAKARAAFQSCYETWRRLHNADPANARRRLDLMGVLPRVGRIDEALAMADAIRAVKDPDAEQLVEAAECLAQCAAAVDDTKRSEVYRTQALTLLDRAAAKGYRDVVYLERDLDFEPLRPLPAFRALCDALRNRDRPGPR